MTGRAIIRLLIGAGLVGLVFAALDSGDVLARLHALEPGWLTMGLTALCIQTLLSAWRWRITAGQLGVQIGRGRAIREYYQAQFLNQILPGGMIGDLGRALRSADQAGLLRAGQAVVLERLMGNAALLAVMGAALITVWLLPDQGALPLAILRLFAGAVLVIAAVVILIGFWPGNGRLARMAADLRGAVRVALFAPAVMRRQMLLSLGTVLANILAFACAARATGADLSMLTSLILIPPILFAMLIPVSFSGWGLREGAAAALFPLAGFSPEAGLAASIAFGLIFLISSLPGLVVLLTAAAGNARRGKRVSSPDPMS